MIFALRAFEEAYQPVLDGMLTTLSRLGVTFDVFTPESKFLLDGSVDRLMLELRASELHGVAENGAEYLDLGARGLKGKPEFFYRRSDGSSLYATRDLAYHRWKWTQSERLINILGEDHRLQSEQVGLTLEELGVRRPEVIFYAFIKLPEGKMSTRAGRVVFMDDLIEEAIERAREVVLQRRGATDPTLLERISTAVAASAIRFNIIKVSLRRASPSVGRKPCPSTAGALHSSCTVTRERSASIGRFRRSRPRTSPWHGTMHRWEPCPRACSICFVCWNAPQMSFARLRINADLTYSPSTCWSLRKHTMDSTGTAR